MYTLRDLPQPFHLTPAYAEEYISLPQYAEERDVTPSHVDELVRRIINKKFHVAFIAVAFIDGVKHKANGQHTCHAVIKAGVPSVPAVLLEFDCDDELDYADLYCNIDDALSLRTARHRRAALSYALGGELRRSTAKVCNLVQGAIGWLEFGHTYRNFKAADKLDMLKRPHAQGLAKFFNTLDIRAHSFLAREPVAVAMAQTWIKNEAEALKFWEKVRDIESITLRNPARLLHDYLVDSDDTIHRGVLSADEFDRIRNKCALAWNVRGAERTKLQVVENSYVEVLD